MMLIDTHTHLYLKQFDEDRKEVIEKALEQNIQRFYLPNIDSSTIKPLKKLAIQYPEYCYPMMGLHPCSVKADYEKELSIIFKELEIHHYHAVGEIGIDLHWNKSTYDMQKDAFIQQAEFAKKNKLPIVIHCRKAFDETLELLDQLNDDKLFGIFHCFTGNLEQAQKIINYGNFKLGIGGVLTFKNAGLDKVIEKVGTEHLVLETDSPYLAPAPYRGKRNESSYMIKVAQKLADLHDKSLEEVAEITTRNATSIFHPGNE